MTLQEVVGQLDTFEEMATICAREPWTAASEAVVVQGDAKGALPPGVREQGFAYLLEIDIARDLLRQYEERKSRTLTEKLDFLIYYAENDAFPDDD